MRAIVLVGTLLAGCSAVAPKTTDAIADGIEAYCAATSPEARVLIRADLNAKLAARAKARGLPPAVVDGVRCPGTASPDK